MEVAKPAAWRRDFLPASVGHLCLGFTSPGYEMQRQHKSPAAGQMSLRQPLM